MINIARPAACLRSWNLPCQGIGLARIEFIIGNIIKIHPIALVHFDKLQDKDARKEIEQLTRGYQDKKEYFVEHLARGIAKFAMPQYPRPVLVRLSDFKGGKQFESEEANPILGFRGASRYYHKRYRDGFKLERAALKRVRDEIGFKNVIAMISVLPHFAGGRQSPGRHGGKRT
jgi:pyruvate, water dikinase